MLVLFRALVRRPQFLAGLQIIVIVELDLSGAEAAFRNPGAEQLVLVKFSADQRKVRQLRDVRVSAVRRARVGQHHGVLAIAVFEKIVNPIHLNQPAAKRQVSLAVLDTVGNLVVVGGEAEFEVRKPSFGKYLLDDFLYRLVQKNAAIGLVTQEIEPWAQHQSVVEKIVDFFDPLSANKDTVEEANLTLVSL